MMEYLWAPWRMEYILGKKKRGCFLCKRLKEKKNKEHLILYQGQHVFVIKPDKQVEIRPVVVGPTNEGEAVITKGLAPGEQIVREGQFLLGPGSRVEIKDQTQTLESKQEKKQRKEKS